MISSNLPVAETSNQQVKTFFDKRTQKEVTFAASQIDAVVGFFLKRSFDQSSARSTAIVLLNQAKTENVNVFQIIDTLKTLTDVQLSQVVTQILNAYRDPTSLLGYRINGNADLCESRNILV